MRRYGKADYGGRTNIYPLKEQPAAFTQYPPRSTDVRRYMPPPDLAPRKPSAPGADERVSLAPDDLLNPQQWIDALVDRLKREHFPLNNYDALRYGSFKTLPFSIGTSDRIVLDKATDIRIYLFIINTHPLNDLFMNFQAPASALTVPISPARGFYEMIFPVPQDAIHLVASAAGTTGVVVFGERDPAVLNRQPGPL
jgi:hypothetical protein